MVVRSAILTMILLPPVLVLGGCSSEPSDPEPNLHMDAGKDTSASDAGDALIDSPFDSVSDVFAEAQIDAQIDGQLDAPSDAEVDAAVDALADAEMDALLDVTMDVWESGSDVVQEASGPGQVDVQVNAANDALSSYLMSPHTGDWNLFHGATVHLGRHFDTGNVSYHTALRFTGVGIPQSAVITSARLTFHGTNEVDSSNHLWINLYAEKAGDSAAFDPSNYWSGRPDQRLKTNNFIDRWLVRCRSDCTDLNEWDCPQRKLDCWNREVPYTVPKDLKALVQEVVDQPSWAWGNALTILLINAATDQDGPNYRGSRSITGYDPSRGPEYSPKLSVAYDVP